MQQIELESIIPESYRGKRLDQVLAELFSDYSRERIKSWILSEACKVDGKTQRPRDKVLGGELVVINAIAEEEISWEGEDLSFELDIVYEDEDVLVLNKPMNCVVHPGSGNSSGTLVNALLNYLPDLKNIPRAGIVHRLDKDTTGLMVVAKSLPAHTSLVNQLQDKTAYRGYEAIVNREMISGGEVSEPIGRSTRSRTKMAVTDKGKPAKTHYRVVKKFKAHTHISLQLETGRTHQIRVHMDYIRHSIVGDKTYGRLRLPKGVSHEVGDALREFPRQALHAKKLGLKHPISSEDMQWEVDLPQDMQDLLKLLENS